MEFSDTLLVVTVESSAGIAGQAMKVRAKPSATPVLKLRSMLVSAETGVVEIMAQSEIAKTSDPSAVPLALIETRARQMAASFPELKNAASDRMREARQE